MIFEKYKVSIQSDLILNLVYWKDITENSHIDSEKINNEIIQSKYYIDENIESWKKLSHYLDLDDSNFDEIFNDLFTNLSKCKYDNLFQTMLISSTILKLKDLGLIKETEENILSMLENKLIIYLKIN